MDLRKEPRDCQLFEEVVVFAVAMDVALMLLAAVVVLLLLILMVVVLVPAGFQKIGQVSASQKMNQEIYEVAASIQLEMLQRRLTYEDIE